jgi:hypothetical protein
VSGLVRVTDGRSAVNSRSSEINVWTNNAVTETFGGDLDDWAADALVICALSGQDEVYCSSAGPRGASYMCLALELTRTVALGSGW